MSTRISIALIFLLVECIGGSALSVKDVQYEINSICHNYRIQ